MLAHQQSTSNNNKVYWCLCVNANLYIENSVPDIQLLRNQKSNIVVGTDSLSSNHSLSILDELKTIHKRFPDIPLAETLQWATLNGARALQLNHQFGSLEIAKKPGIIVLENVGEVINENTTVKRVL
jgi:cytosine/adenosine deaminase-related metal-dependent hydrolase